MNIINLAQIPNQEFFTIVEGKNINFRLHTFRDVLYCDVEVNGEVVAYSVRCTNKGWILPSRFNKSIGNFRFETADGVSYPDADNFGDTCTLAYYAPEEI